MKKQKLLIYLIVMLSFSIFIWGCKTSRDAQDELEKGSVIEEIFEAAAKYVGYNLNKDSLTKGVYKVSAEGTQAFDPYNWGMDGGTQYFLENSNKTISQMKTWSTPDPTENDIDLFNTPFADGTFVDSVAISGEWHPMFVTARSETNYNGSGTALTNNYWKWVVEYYSSTGYPSSFTKTYVDSNGDPITMSGARTVYGFATDTAFAAINNYYVTSETDYDYDGSSFTRTQKDTFTKSGTWTPTTEDSTRTYICYGADDDTLSTSCGYDNSAAKWVKTQLLSGTTMTETSKYYDTTLVETNREVVVKEYGSAANVARFHFTTYVKKRYSVAADGTTTLTYQEDRTYTNGFQVTQTDYSVSAGTATMSSTGTYTRDAQGRTTDYIRKDANGDPDKHLVYTFDSNGTRTSMREYGYTGGVQDTTPECVWGYNFDWSHSRDSSNIVTRQFINYCNSGTYYPDGYSKNISVYNAMGLQTSNQDYSYSGSTATLSGQTTMEYDANGNQTKEQYYSVSSGTATAGAYITYSYDANLFLVTSKNYDSSDELQLQDWSNSCASNTSGNCYSVVTYTYK